MDGKILIFSAPSGAGKTTIVRHLLNKFSNLEFSISACTRAKRENETDGKDYYFLSVEEFKEKIKKNEFIEWEEVYENNFYGSLKSEIQRIWNNGNIAVFDIDVKGGLNIKKLYRNNALAIFISPPSIDILKERLKNRHSETEESLKVRVQKAIYEMTFANKFDIQIINNKLEDTLLEAEQIVNKFIQYRI
jgi:guanylate kinase